MTENTISTDRFERAMRRIGITDETPLTEVYEAVVWIIASDGILNMDSEWRKQQVTRRHAVNLFKSIFDKFFKPKTFGTGTGGIRRYGCSRFEVNYYSAVEDIAIDIVPKLRISPSRANGIAAKHRFFKDMDTKYERIPYEAIFNRVHEIVKAKIKKENLASNRDIIAHFVGKDPVDATEYMADIMSTFLGPLDMFGLMGQDKIGNGKKDTVA